MKRCIVCVTSVALLACATMASAQIAVGAKGGYNLANMSVSGLETDWMNPGTLGSWMAGGFIEFPLTKKILLRPELLYTTNGTDIPHGFVLRLSYIDVPMLLQLDVRESGKAIPYLYGGPTFGFLVGAKQTFSSGISYDVKSSAESTHMGLAFGAGVRVDRFLVEGRYVQGLTNVVKQSTGLTYKSRQFTIIGGVRF